MTNLYDAQIRSALISERIRQRTDLTLRELIAQYQNTLTFHPLDDLMISEQAWRHVEASGIDPKLVFAHPELLRKLPALSQYYRGLALLPRKRVTDIAGSVDSWEDGTRKTPIPEQRSKDVARLYNAVISSIIEGAVNWTLENGYRNIIANMGIGLDGTFRNIIGRDAEALIRNRIKNWLTSHGLIIEHNDEETEFQLPDGYFMHYGSEPDVRFQKEQYGILHTVATIEIKGGKDPAGALERLGAMQKSFEETPPGCVNMLIAGVVTPEMESRLENMGVTKVFLLDDLAHDSEDWIDFLNEVFHYTIRITDSTITG
ncbi:MAG: XcyI family restriction endonuclease [Dehalococcoidia bacterium]|nr:XcyI family restriction endonuclease [Dehalococcoidia bacterium]